MFQNGKMEASIRTLVIYTSIPSLAITAASSILVSIPPVVSCAATDISTAVHGNRYLTLQNTRLQQAVQKKYNQAITGPQPNKP